MEKMENKDSIGKNYSILNKIGSGGQATCYLVKKKDENIECVAKMVKKLDKAEEEIRLTKIISSIDPPIPYVIKLIEEGNGDFKRGERKLENQRYFILEYAKKGDLFKYIYILKKGFGERCGKLLFYKILLGVQACHNAGIFHLDLKLENIVLDEKFVPKICDFGLATDNRGNLSKIVGTLEYAPPQINEKREYTGEGADIFYLGSVLFMLVVGKRCFGIAKKNDYYYSEIVKKNKDGYFDKLKAKINSVVDLTEVFRELLVKMLAYEEGDRGDIEAIINDKWFNDLKNNEEKKKIENDLNDMFKYKDNLINQFIEANPNYLTRNNNITFEGNRGKDEDFEEEIFPHNLIPKKKNMELGPDVYIKIKGNLDYYRFMNILVDKIKKVFKKEHFFIDKSKSKKKYECNIIFEANDENDEEEEEEKEDKNDEVQLDLNLEDNKEDCVIQLKLFESDNEENKEYALRLLRISGTLAGYYQKAIKIVDIAKKLI